MRLGFYATGAASALFLAGCGGSSGTAGSAGSKPIEPIEMGAPLKTGDLELTVTGVETRDRVGIPYAYEEASEGAVLVVVKTKLKNTGTKPVQAFETPTMSLVDSAGTTYSADIAKTTAYQMQAKTNAKFLSDLNPGVTTQDADVFEVAKDKFDAKTWRLIAGDKSHPLALADAENSKPAS